MRKTLALLLSVLMLLGLLAGCDEEEEPVEIETHPKVTAAPEEETTEPAEETAGETEISEETGLITTVLRSGDPELRAEYILLAVNPEGPFRSEVTLNEAGADALIRWLTTEQVRTVLENFGTEAYGEPVFSLPEETSPIRGWIPNATEENKTIRLSVADTLEESGILDQLLPVFEETYGYTVEVSSTSATGTLTAAKLGIIDVVLTETTKTMETFLADGYAREADGLEGEAVPFCGLEYLLCGSVKDPAGAATAETLADALAAIADGQHIFLSRGDGSTLHKLEQRLWPAGQEFGEWYLEIDTDMGPLLVMNEFEGGYLLADKLTWLIFCHNNGII